MSWIITPSGGNPDAVNWQQRVLANGGTVSRSTMAAVSTFCDAINAEPGLRAAITRLNLFCGDNLSSCLVPLYLAESFGSGAKGNATDTNNGFVSGDYVATGANGGLKGTGTAWLNTGLNQNDFGTSTSKHLSVSAVECATGAIDYAFLGSYQGSPFVDGTIFILDEVANYLGTNSRTFRCGTAGTTAHPLGTKVATESHLLGSFTASNLVTLYRAGSSIATATLSRTTSFRAIPVAIFGIQPANPAVTPVVISLSRMRMYSIGSGVTASQASAFASAVASFNTALGRT